MVKLLPTQIVIAAFNEQDAAETAANALAQGMANQEFFYTNLATVQKDQKGNIKVKESGDLTVDISTAYSATAGALLGGLSCMLIGPAGVAAGAAAGAVIGGAGAKTLTKGSIEKDKVKQLGDSLPLGSSALIAVFDELPIEQDVWKTQEVQQFRHEIVYELSRHIGDSLREGEDVVYMYALTPDGIIATRMACGDDAMDIRGLVVAEKGVAIGEAAATDNMLVYEAAALSEEGIEATAGVVIANVEPVEEGVLDEAPVDDYEESDNDDNNGDRRQRKSKDELAGALATVAIGY